MAATESVAVVMPLQEAEDSTNERLRKEGEVTEDASTSILKTYSHPSTFVVYFNPAQSGPTLSTTRVHAERVEEDLTEHLPISETEEGKSRLSGQAKPEVDAIEVVNPYLEVSEFSPALIPALGKSSETQISIPDEPPDYDKANRALQPDIAPLPSIPMKAPTEAKTTNIYPSSSLRTGQRDYYSGPGRGGPSSGDYYATVRATCWDKCREWYYYCCSGRTLKVVLYLLLFLTCGCCLGFVICCALSVYIYYYYNEDQD